MLKKTIWLALTLSVAFASLVGLRAQQPATAPPYPPLPQPYFRAREDTSKFGRKPEDIKAGERPDYAKIRDPLEIIPVQGNIHLIGGGGGNVAVQVGDDGVLLVNSGVEAVSDRMIAAYKSLSPRNLRWIVNTSADLKYTGGNEKVASSGTAGGAGFGGGGGQAGGFQGGGAGVISHENVLNRMSAPTGQTASRPVAAWPTDTFFTAKKSLWYNDEPIEFHYIAAAHNDGDILVFFRKSDVVAAGEILATDHYPMWDPTKGGSYQGVLDGLNRLIDIAVPEYNQQGGTRVIPGSGRICNETDVVEYRDMATIIRDRINMMVKKGVTLEQVKAAHPSLDYDGNYGSATGEWTTDTYITALYNEQVKLNTPPPAKGKTPAKKS